MKTKPKT